MIRRNGCPVRASRLLLAAVLALLASGMQAQDPPAAAGATPATTAPPATGATPATTAPPATIAPPLLSHEVQGIKNFGQVTPRLYRGAQPAEKGYELLEKMGVDIIVDFRNEKDLIERERKAVETRHIRFISIPWSAFHDPTAAQVLQFFNVLRENPDKRIFLHCEVGADRTGTMVAMYRIAAQGWKVDDAVREMKAYHFHRFWFSHLQDFVEEFPKRLESDAALHGILATPQPAPPSP